MGEDSVTETNPERFALWQSVAPVGGQQMDSTKDENAYITIHRPEGLHRTMISIKRQL